MSIGRFSGLEGVPHVSQAANSALLSDTKEYPFFSRLVPPNNGTGEGKPVKTSRFEEFSR